MRTFFKLLVAVVILAVIVLAAPFGMGLVGEKEAHKKVKEIQAKLTEYPNVDYKLTAYKRGFFTSEAQELVVLKNIKINGKTIGPVQLIINDEIQHGPVILSRDSKGKWDFWVGRAMLKSQVTKVIGLGVKPLPVDFYRGYIGFAGDIKVIVDVPKLSVDLPVLSVVLEGLKDILEISHDHKRVTNHFVLKHGLAIDKIQPKKLEVKGLETETDVTKDSQGLWLGSRRLEAVSLVAGLEGKVYTMQGLYAKIMDLKHDQKIKSEVVLNVRSVGVGEKSFGPHRLVLDIDGVDASIVSKMNKTLIKITQEEAERPQSGSNAKPQSNKNQVLINKMGDLASDLIKKGFSIQLKTLEVSTAWGKLMADAKIQIPNLSNRQAAGSKQLSLLSSILNMDSMMNAKIPSGLLKTLIEQRYRKLLEAQQQGQMQQPQNLGEMADKHMAKLVSEGWFIPNGDIYDITLSFRKGQFLVNNKPLKPQELLPEISQPPVPEMPAQGNEEAPASANDVQQPAPVSSEIPANSQPQGSMRVQNELEMQQQAQNEHAPSNAISSMPAEEAEKHMLRQDVQDAPISESTQAPQPASVMQPLATPAAPAQAPAVETPAPAAVMPNTTNPQLPSTQKPAGAAHASPEAAGAQ